jgi:hypothetical protein
MKHTEMIMVIEAHSEGKSIECKAKEIKRWSNASHPIFNFSQFDYRVKPEPKYKTYSFGSCTKCSTGESYEFVEKKALEDALELSSGMIMTADDIAIYKELYSLLN